MSDIFLLERGLDFDVLVVIGSTHGAAQNTKYFHVGRSAVDFFVVTVHQVTRVMARIEQSTAYIA